MDRTVVDRWCERGVLALVLAILVFGPLATGAVRTLEFLIIQGLTIGVMTLWGIRLWLRPRPKLLWPPICWLVVAFVAYAIGRYLTADIEYVARQELIRILVYAFLFLAILNNLHGQEETQIVAFTMVFLGMAISFYAIYQFLTGSDHVWHFINPYKHRGSGTYISPNHLAGFLGMLLPVALTYTLVGRLKPLTKVLLGYAALVMVAGIGVTVSRGGWVASALALAVLCGILVRYRTFRIQSLVLLVVLIAGGAFFISRSIYIQHRLREVSAGEKVESDVRYEIWDATARMWQDHLWWGVGPGHFDYRFREYRPNQIQARPDCAHNEYLNTLADWGLAGTAIVAAAWVALYWGVVKIWRHVRRADRDFGNQHTNKFAFVLGASLGLFALLVHSVVDFNLHIPANAILAISLMALTTSHWRFATERFWNWIDPPLRLGLSAVLLAGIAYLGYQAARRGSEYVWLQRVPEAPNSAPARLAALAKAFAAEPRNFETTYALAETYRAQCWQAFDGGYDAYRALAPKAMEWYGAGMKLNPYDPRNHVGYGMCLDRLDRTSESEPFYDKADLLDPNGYFTAAHVGWHYVQVGNYAAAKVWLERSRRLQWKNNWVADTYLELVNQRLREAAAAR